MKTIFLTLFVSSTLLAYAQIIGSSKVKIQTQVGNKLVRLESTEAMVTLNTQSNLIRLVIPMHSIDGELDTIDNYFDNYNMAFTFECKNPLSIQQLIIKEQSLNNIMLTDGTCTLNGRTTPCTANASIFKQNNEEVENLKNLRISLFIQFQPQQLKINEYFNQIVNPIRIEMDQALLNIEE